MDTASSPLPLSSYFRHRTATGPPPMPSMTGIIVGPPSSSSSSAPITSSAITSTATSSAVSISSTVPPLASSSSLVASSTTVRTSSSSESRFAGSLTSGFGIPSASVNSSTDTSSSKPISSSTLAAICIFITVAALGITLWVGKKCCIDRARRKEEEQDGTANANDNRYSEGWAKRLTFTGNREKFWHRLDDYHDSLKAREEGRIGPGQVVGGVVGKKRRSRIAPELMSMRMSAVPTFTHSRSTTPKLQQPQQHLGQTYDHNHGQQGHGHGNGHGPQPDQWLKNDNSSVKTFMIGNDDELAYLSTMIDDKSQVPSPQALPQAQPQSVQSFPIPSVQAPASASYSISAPTPYDAPAGSHQLTPEDVGNAVTTSIPASSSREKISLSAYSFSGSLTTGVDHHKNKRLSTMSTISTGTGGVGNAMLSSGGGSINEQSSEKKPSQYLSTASAYLTPNYGPPTNQNQSQLQSDGRPQTDYRSPTESICGCYKEDDDRHASFISTTGGGKGTSKGAEGVPAVPPIPAVYRQ